MALSRRRMIPSLSLPTTACCRPLISIPTVTTTTTTTFSSAPFSASDLEKLQVLGHGSGGTVYKVLHKPTSTTYALKQLDSSSDDDNTTLQSELDILRRTTASPNVVHCHDINSIRKGPVGSQIKSVIDLLLKTREALNAEQIKKACYVDVNANNNAVFNSLRNNPKVHYDEGERLFSYKCKHDLKDKNQLRSLIRRYSDGIPVIDLKDSFPTVMEDLQALKAAGDIWLLSNLNSQEDDVIAYPNDPSCRLPKVDDELKTFFREIELPRDMLDIERDIQKNGMKPATDTAKRRAAAQSQGIQAKSMPKKKKKKNEINKRTKLTNAHLPELFKDRTSKIN